MADRVLLTDKGIKALPPAPKGKRYDTWDTLVAGFTVRTTDKGAKTFQLMHRLPGETHPTRLTIGAVEKHELAVARKIAVKWLGLIADGHDPRDVEEQTQKDKKKAKADDADMLFPVIAETYIAATLQRQKNRNAIELIIRNEFMVPWKDTDIRTIETLDVSKLIEAKAKTAPGQARCLLNHIKQMFKWCVSTGRIKHSPAQAVDTGRVFGPLIPRERALTDAELTRVWNAALEMGYPYGPICLLLILTGCRLNEIAELQTSEIDFRKRLIVIPKERMKGKPGKRKAHVIPLTDMMIAILRPLIKDGYLFSSDGGVSPIWTNRMCEQITERARVYKWVNHDLRRTMRSHLETEEVGVAWHIAEEMIAHHKTGMNAVYNQNQYLKEKTAGFIAWNARVEQITGGLPKRLKLVA